MKDQIIKPIDVMTDNELISTLTIYKDNFNEDYREKARAELQNRGINFEDILKEASFKINEKE